MMSNVEWVVDKVTGEKHSTIYLCCSEPFPDVRYHLHIIRKPRYYQTHILFPSIVITLLATLGYILPVDSGGHGRTIADGFAVTSCRQTPTLCRFTSLDRYVCIDRLS